MNTSHNSKKALGLNSKTKQLVFASFRDSVALGGSSAHSYEAYILCVVKEAGMGKNAKSPVLECDCTHTAQISQMCVYWSGIALTQLRYHRCVFEDRSPTFLSLNVV